MSGPSPVVDWWRELVHATVGASNLTTCPVLAALFAGPSALQAGPALCEFEWSEPADELLAMLMLETMSFGW